MGESKRLVMHTGNDVSIAGSKKTKHWRILRPGLVTGSREDLWKKVVYRNNFRSGLLDFVDWYGKNLSIDQSLQQAFIRKFDSLCE
jgi:hypothetical protein